MVLYFYKWKLFQILVDLQMISAALEWNKSCEAPRTHLLFFLVALRAGASPNRFIFSEPFRVSNLMDGV